MDNALIQASQHLQTIRDWLRFAVSHFEAAKIFYGHGTHNAYDEAAWLILRSLHLPIDSLEPFLDARVLPGEASVLAERIRQRVDERVPTAYLTGEAWLHGFRFKVTPDVIVPRSYLAGMVLEQMAPWLEDPENVSRVLDLCTGSGCLAILLAHAFPHARVDAVDLSPAALAVARENVADYGLGSHIELIESDLFTALAGRTYDLIISNPPYVDAPAMASLPAEYRHEPDMALGSGDDGLDATRRILAAAATHLNPGGLLAVEIGHNRAALEAAFPDLELTWPELEGGDDTVFVVHREPLESLVTSP